MTLSSPKNTFQIPVTSRGPPAGVTNTLEDRSIMLFSRLPLDNRLER